VFWSAEIASHVVDLVHFASPANENNEVVRTKIKEGFFNGIVVDWSDIEAYIEEDDCIVIGPGMVRAEGADSIKGSVLSIKQSGLSDLAVAAASDDTATIVNTLLAKYPNKKWVVDGGALQEVEPNLLNENMIATPHLGEFKRLISNSSQEFLISKSEFLNNFQNSNDQIDKTIEYARYFSQNHNNVTVMLKGVKTVVVGKTQEYVIGGGNEGLTKGGTGDVLAGLTGALYSKNPPELSAAAASMFSKTAADRLYKDVGPFYNTSDTIKEIPKVMKELMGY
jgi:NAD(P)H-hydrate epimerase